MGSVLIVPGRVIERGGGSMSDAKTRNDSTSRNVHIICRVSIFFKSVVTIRDLSMRTQPSSVWKRRLIVSGRGFSNFNSILIVPFSGNEECASVAATSGVRSKSSMKYPFTYM